MADKVSNVNAGSSINDSLPVIVQQADVTSRSEGAIGSEMSGFVPPVRFGSYSEYSCDYNVGSTSNVANSMIAYRQQVKQSHHDLVNLLTQQMTTILNPMMADHESKFEHLARQVERIAQIVDYEECERHNVRRNNEGFENIFQNENNVFDRENPHNVRSRCYFSFSESEVVKIVIMGLEFYMHRKLLNVSILDLVHLVEKVRQTKFMKNEKEKHRNE
ncbi:hypothetical protein Ahy_A06g028359 [Arachis hypogaea]|uniref:Uncharacterized protein n=1 Tax=Arachis hypogaea TaxID=3818 RepID=A0A445CQV7_ARAHY|nr:hypothetical protein Ahy_A06g028359 [Arachis hypogaea]